MPQKNQGIHHCARVHDVSNLFTVPVQWRKEGRGGESRGGPGVTSFDPARMSGSRKGKKKREKGRFLGSISCSPPALASAI